MSKNDKTTRLAPDLEISKIVTGLWQIADMERDDKALDLEQTARHMGAYTEAGLTTFDMADHYGSAEVIAGLFAREHGHDCVQLFTKWVPRPGPADRDDVRKAVQTALERLRSDRLDLLQFHAWNYADPSYLDTLTYLQELKADPERPASGTVLEARLDKGRGPVATVLIQDGHLEVGVAHRYGIVITVKPHQRQLVDPG